MKKLISIIIILNLLVSCAFQNKSFKNTKWIYDFGECQDILEFKDENQYTFYSCETNEKVFGNYTIENDLIILEQKKGKFDEEFNENSRHRTSHLKFKLRLKSEELIYEERLEKDENSNWIKSDFDFDNSYHYKRLD